MSAEPEKPEDEDAWIEKVVNVAGHLGFNKMRLRWKLIRWQENRRKERRRREQVVQHITYAHKTCPECGAVQDKDEQVCTSCGAKLGKRGFQILGRIGMSMPVALSVSTLIALAILTAYGRVWMAAGGGFGSPSGQLLVDFGGRWPPLMHEEPWRLVTAVFLHAGLLHLAFNLLAIATIGPRIEELYGRATTIGLFVVTGVLANLGTLQVGPYAVGIGASGGLMGLIGVAAGYGQRAGTGRGRGLRDDMLKWSAYTFIFGFAAHADNWAHLFGLLSGAAFGFAVRPETWTRSKALLPFRFLLGAAGAVATIGALAIIFTRHPTPPEETEPSTAAINDELRDAMKKYGDICVKYYANDLPGAIAAAKAFAADGLAEQVPYDMNEAAIQSMCETIQQMRATCAADRRTANPELRKSYDQMCAMYEPVFGIVPVRPPKHPELSGMMLDETATNGSADSGSGSAEVGSASSGSAENH